MAQGKKERRNRQKKERKKERKKEKRKKERKKERKVTVLTINPNLQFKCIGPNCQGCEFF